ncbi:uncharacterized protein LOC120353157 [Nilaparvata lugens]|uniref:uncharacterized protein LOC120353157 n=1 Tax=Nilaparvata lugens TaxID=108931 RepID=UPI00193CF810|nr:uncharacterized protein LOC120353157 [Nilaparvata lugens]
MRIIFSALVLSACLHRLLICAAGTTERKLDRRKRYLAFPKGSSLQLVYCFLVAALGSQNIFTVGITLGLAWEIPSRIPSSITSQHTIRKRQDGDSLYPRLEAFLDRLGMNGQSCVMRAICEAMYRKSTKLSFIEEMIHSVFTYPEVNSEDPVLGQDSLYDLPRYNATACIDYYRKCPISLLDHYFVS